MADSTRQYLNKEGVETLVGLIKNSLTEKATIKHLQVTYNSTPTESYYSPSNITFHPREINLIKLSSYAGGYHNIGTTLVVNIGNSDLTMESTDYDTYLNCNSTIWYFNPENNSWTTTYDVSYILGAVSAENIVQALTNKNGLLIIPNLYSLITSLPKYQLIAKDYVNWIYESLNTKINALTGVEFSIVETLPDTGEDGTIYLLAHQHGDNDIYDEYIYVNSAWEKIGSTDIDLTGYLKDSDLIAVTSSEITEMWNSTATE